MTYDPYDPTRHMNAAPQSSHNYGQQVPPVAYQPTPKKAGPLKILLITLGVIVGVCSFGTVVAALANSGSDKTPTAAVVATTAPAKRPILESTTGTPAPLDAPEKAAEVKMPDVRGQNAAVAQDYLQKLGLTNVTFGSQDELDTWVVLPENWTVKKQSTKPGRKIPADTLIVLTCTKIG